MQQFGKLKVYFKSYNIQDKVVFYTIKVEEQDTNISWLIQTRYSEVRQLHFQLKKNYKGQLPNFPAKKWFGNLNKDFINFRQKQLIAYINLILINIEKSKVEDLYLFLSNRTVDQNQMGNNNNEISNINLNKKDRFEKVKEEISNKMIDLSYNIQPPDDFEIKQKQKLYSQMNFKVKDKNIPSHLVKSISQLLSNENCKVNKESFYSRNQEFITNLDQQMMDLKRKVNEMNNIISQNNMLVHLLE